MCFKLILLATRCVKKHFTSSFHTYSYFLGELWASYRVKITYFDRISKRRDVCGVLKFEYGDVHCENPVTETSENHLSVNRFLLQIESACTRPADFVGRSNHRLMLALS